MLFRKLQLAEHSLKDYMSAAANMGLPSLAYYTVRRLINATTRAKAPYKLYSKHLKHPVLCRPFTSDRDSFNQNLLFRELQCIDDVRDVELIIDCGANVGYTSCYLLSRFPRAFVIAVEPDPDNFGLLKRNLAPYGARYEAINSGIWSQEAGLVLSEEKLGNGQEWARQVREVRPGETPQMIATDIGTLLERSGCDRISILKVDIEGSEAKVFSENYEGWIDRVDTLLIETHSEECEAVFRRAMVGRGFSISAHQSLWVGRRGGAATRSPGP
jgi:FkbM family methyltransferase